MAVLRILFRGYFSVFAKMITGYLMIKNGEKDQKKMKK
ncbi:hypothetical protein NSB1T_07610 [Coprobacter fastidiosus NSB1 = JCM 33896]|nr:hypothetical protein NSB1T_07610 [Coprobacter fastidiosus NSB1 = JCM 33896]